VVVVAAGRIVVSASLWQRRLPLWRGSGKSRDAQRRQFAIVYVVI
jgi:hypothetical protein